MNRVLSPQEHKGLKRLKIRSTIQHVKNKMEKMDGVEFGDCFPLKHTYADGCYVREIFIPKGNFVIGKIHKHSHPNFLLEGEVSVLTEGRGAERLKAPLSMVSEAGTQRIVYTHTDCRWVTVHVTCKKDLKEIEEEVIAKDYKEIPGLEEKCLGLMSLNR